LSELKKAGLGTRIRRQGIKFRPADSSEQDCVTFQTLIQSVRRQRRSALPNRSATDQLFPKSEIISAKFSQRPQDTNRLLRYLWADSVSGQNGYL
jgi:hypothetical protein